VILLQQMGRLHRVLLLVTKRTDAVDRRAVASGRAGASDVPRGRETDPSRTQQGSRGSPESLAAVV
jgi:hypothetical protein